MFRIGFSIIFLCSVLFAPFWLSIIMALFGVFYFSVFWEGLILFLLSDLIYGVKEEKFFNIIFISLIIGTLCLVLIEILKKKLKFYKMNY